MHQSDSDEDPLLLVGESFRPAKRRRISSAELVESSDAEEQDEAAAGQPNYWEVLPNPPRLLSGPPSESSLDDPMLSAPPTHNTSPSTSPKGGRKPSSQSRSHYSASHSFILQDNYTPASIPLGRLSEDVIDEELVGDPSRTSCSFPPPDITNASPKTPPPIGTGDAPGGSTPAFRVQSSPDIATPVLPSHQSQRAKSSTEAHNTPESQTFPFPSLHATHGDAVMSTSTPSENGDHSPSFRSKPLSHSQSRQSTPIQPDPHTTGPDAQFSVTPPRRNLRQRTAAQKQPYTYDYLRYKTLLSRAGAKDAVVKDPRLMRDAQSQNTGDMEDSQDWQESNELEDSQSQPVVSPVQEHRPPHRAEAQVHRPPPRAPKRSNDHQKMPRHTTDHRAKSPARLPTLDETAFIRAYGGYVSDEEDPLLGLSNRPPTRPSRSDILRAFSPESASKAPSSSSPTAVVVTSSIPRHSTPLAQSQFGDSSSPSPPRYRQSMGSDDDGQGKEGNSSNSSETEDSRLRKIDEKRRKVANRVLPAFMLKRLERQEARAVTQRTQRQRTIRSSSPEDDNGNISSDHSDILPNARTFRGGRLEIQGDPESSDPEVIDEVVVPMQQPRTLARRQYERSESSSSSSSSGSDVELVERDDIHHWFEQPRLKTLGTSRQSALKEPDLVDRMLSRTRHVGSGLSTHRKAPSKVSRKTRNRADKSQPAKSRQSLSLPTKRRPRYEYTQNTKSRLKQTRLDQAIRPRSTAEKSGGVRGKPRPHHRMRPARDIAEPIEISDQDDPPSPRVVEHELFEALEPIRQIAPPTSHVGDASRLTNRLLPHPPSHLRPQRRPEAVQPSVARLGRRGVREEVIDFGIPVPPSGASFAPNTYVKSGRLQELVSLLDADPVNAHPPTPYGNLQETLTISELSNCLPELFDSIHDWARLPNNEGVIDFEGNLRFICQYVSWVGNDSPESLEEDIARLLTLLEDQIRHLIHRFSDPSTADEMENEERVLWVCWFAVELSLRMWRVQRIGQSDAWANTGPLDPASPVDRYLHVLMARLVDFGMEKTGDMLINCNNDQPVSTFKSSSVQLWVCLFQVLQAIELKNPQLAAPPFGHPLWNRLAQITFGVDASRPLRGLELSESAWRCIFTMIILSRFTVFGVVVSRPKLSPSWPLVIRTLNFVRLEADLEADRHQPSGLLHKRDSYIKLLLARCLYLVTQWNWSLRGADALFKSLTTIFRSRKFNNLRGEAVDFPCLVREQRDTLCSGFERRDTAFGIFLKLVAHAARDYEVDGAGGQTKMRKLVSLIFPVGSASFTKENPPIGTELSMLFNRFATVIVAVHIEPGQASKRVQQARGFLDFAKAEVNSRSCAIRGLMLIGMTHMKLSLSVVEVMAWYSEMVKVVLEDLKAAEKRTGSVPMPANLPGGKTEMALLVLQLVGALRRIIEARPTDEEKRIYPDPVMLEKACLPDIMESSLANDIRTSVEIRKLLQSFLNARSAALPVRYQAPLPPERMAENESQESDEYGAFALDFDDPALLQIIGEREPTEIEKMDLHTAEVMKSTLSPAIFKLIKKYFGESGRWREALGDISKIEVKENDQRWIECWVGCIDILVRNNMKEWPQYAEWGEESLDRIVDGDDRREIELSFLLAVLRIDPTAYARNREWFFKVWLTSLGSTKYTHEHTYTGVLFSVDKAANRHHPLLRELPADADEDVSMIELRRKRLALVKGVVSNLDEMLLRNGTTTEERQMIASGRDGMVGLLGTMRAHCEAAKGREEDEEYFAFCQGVVECVKGSRLWQLEPRMTNTVGSGHWWRSR